MIDETVTLYRGISVASQDAENIRKRILKEGIAGDEGRWKLSIHDRRSDLDNLFLKSNLSLKDIDTEDTQFEGICACGDLNGAAYYAHKHNRTDEKDTPLAIEFQIPLANVFVDGRDFLYTAFQLWDMKTKNGFDVQAHALTELFGESVLRYFKKAASSEEQQYRIAMCRLAAQDVAVVRSHLQNRHIIKGRYKTLFRSACIVRPPIAASQIHNVEEPPFPTGTPSITLDSFLSADVALT